MELLHHHMCAGGKRVACGSVSWPGERACGLAELNTPSGPRVWRRDDPGAAAAGAGGSGGGGGGGGGGRGDAHIPLFKRQTEPSIEERMARWGCYIPTILRPLEALWRS